MFDFVNKLKDKGRWRIFKLKLIDARLYFVSIFVGLLTGLVAVPYHYLLQFFFNLRHDFFDAHLKWYWYIVWLFCIFDLFLYLADVGNSSICFLARKKNASHYGWRDSTDTWSH